jgi:beta-glucosidase
MTETVLDGFRALVPDGWQVTYARGADIEHLVPDPADPLYPDGQPRPPISQGAQADHAMIAEAAARAEAADVAVVVVGDTVGLTGESRSTAPWSCRAGRSPCWRR